MADIKKITSFDGTTYDIKDASAIADASIDASLLKIKLRNGDSSTRTIMNAPFNYYGNFTGTKANTTSGSYESAKYTGNISDKYTLNSSGLPADGTTLAINVPVAGNGSYFVKMSVDGGTTYAPVVWNLNSTISTRYSANSKIIVTYDSNGRNASMYTAGTKLNATTLGVGCWQIMDYDANSTYTLAVLRHYNGTYTASATDNLYTILLLTSETSLMPISSGTSTSGHTYNTTTAFNPFGQIVYNASSGSTAAGSALTASYLYNLYQFDARYTFNGLSSTAASSAWVTNKDVYLVAIPQSDGTAKLAATPYTQTLPTTEDGNIYIYLGHAYSSYQIELHPVHPIYYYKNGALREWTNAETSEDTDTWREIKVNGEQKIASSSSTALDLSAGSNVTLSYTDNKVVIAATDTTTTKTGHYSPSDKESAYGSASAAFGSTIITGVTLDSKKHVTNVSTATLPSNPNTDYRVTDVASTTKSFLLGHVTQGTNASANTNASCYMSDGYLYSGGTKVLTSYSNTWRPVAMNGTNFLTNSTSAFNVSAGDNITLSNTSNTLVISAASGTTYTAGTNVSINGGIINVSMATLENGSNGIHGCCDSVDVYNVIAEDEAVVAGNLASIRSFVGLDEDYSPIWDSVFPDNTSIAKAIRDLSTNLATKTDTWRAVKVNGTEKISSTTNTALDLSAGSNITLSYTNNKVVIDAAGGSLSENITYSNLVTLKNAGTLVPGKQYRITNYITTASALSVDSFTVAVAGHQFDLVVTANTSTTLYPEAHAALHSGDTYFANASLGNWQIKYDINNDTTKYAWAGASGATGVIYYMKDEHNNEAPYDFKNITIDGYYTFGNDSTDFSVSSDYTCKNNKITPYMLYGSTGLYRINGVYLYSYDTLILDNIIINSYNSHIASENITLNRLDRVKSSTISADTLIYKNTFSILDGCEFSGGDSITASTFCNLTDTYLEGTAMYMHCDELNSILINFNGLENVYFTNLSSEFAGDILMPDMRYKEYKPIVELL